MSEALPQQETADKSVGPIIVQVAAAVFLILVALGWLVVLVASTGGGTSADEYNAACSDHRGVQQIHTSVTRNPIAVCKDGVAVTIK